MKTTKPDSRGLAPKKQVAQQTVDEYLAGVPEPARTTLEKVRAVIRSVVPAGTTEAISYGVPTFKLKGPVIWYAASKGTIQFPVDKPLRDALLKKMVKARLAEMEKKKH